MSLASTRATSIVAIGAGMLGSSGPDAGGDESARARAFAAALSEMLFHQLRRDLVLILDDLHELLGHRPARLLPLSGAPAVALWAIVPQGGTVGTAHGSGRLETPHEPKSPSGPPRQEPRKSHKAPGRT